MTHNTSKADANTHRLKGTSVEKDQHASATMITAPANVIISAGEPAVGVSGEALPDVAGADEALLRRTLSSGAAAVESELMVIPP